MTEKKYEKLNNRQIKIEKELLLLFNKKQEKLFYEFVENELLLEAECNK